MQDEARQVGENTRLAWARSYWQRFVPVCSEESCTAGRRLWRRAHCWNGVIQLHGNQYCAPQCFEKAMCRCFDSIARTVPPAAEVHHRIPLGLLLLSRGHLTKEQLRSALAAQRESGRHRIGVWLTRLGYVTEQQVTAGLGVQWACPVLLSDANAETSALRLLPLRWLQALRMLPLQFVESTRMLYLAFSEGIDYAVLHAVAQMLTCRTEACLISDTAMDRALEQGSQSHNSREFLFEGWRDAAEMARITCGYALRLGAEEVRAVGCGGQVWVRLRAGLDVAHLLFRPPLITVDRT
jgi:hypothetical protein